MDIPHYDEFLQLLNHEGYNNYSSNKTTYTIKFIESNLLLVHNCCIDMIGESYNCIIVYNKNNSRHKYTKMKDIFELLYHINIPDVKGVL